MATLFSFEHFTIIAAQDQGQTERNLLRLPRTTRADGHEGHPFALPLFQMLDPRIPHGSREAHLPQSLLPTTSGSPDALDFLRTMRHA